MRTNGQSPTTPAAPDPPVESTDSAPSAAAEALWIYMRRRNKGLVEIADEVDCSKSHISGLRSGDRKPSAALAKKFETMIGIPFPSWWDFGDENLYEVLQAIEQHENAQRGFKTRVSGNEVRE